MSLSEKEVKHIADLARLELTPEEMARYREQLSAVLDYIERLQTLDTEDIPPTSSVLPTRTPLREDIPRPGLERKELLENAPKTAKHQFQVPPVLDE